ncbi:MAG: FAD-binding protein [Saprospiraceae bacterium]|nr:FAD-binding protein [Saprospiraceae bacterium]
MVRQIEIKLDPKDLYNEEMIRDKITRIFQLKGGDSFKYTIDRRSIDARKKPQFVLQVSVYLAGEEPTPSRPIMDSYRNVEKEEEVYIIGAGPAGYFAALKCLEVGLRPIVIERGKDAQTRRKDLRAIQQFGVVNPDSNYCFGEGGAGTYSDGKLYTRSKKRGNVDQVLKILVEHGADHDILIDAHPHIGSNKLPKIIANIRKTIEQYGGKVLFEHRVEGFTITGHRLTGIQTNKGLFDVRKLILATGHSARDIYHALLSEKIRIDAKPFALGVRIEHPQSLIDKIQYGAASRPENLPAASYRLTCTLEQRGVFSFCMCPGGLIVPAATAPGEIVVNGMSLSRRDSPFANSGMVVSVAVEDAVRHGYSGALACMEFQKKVEQDMFVIGDGSQKAPAQRLSDFINGNKSSELPPTSYIPGILSQRLDQLLPTDIYKHLKRALKYFGQKMDHFVTNDAIAVGVESRTSAPIRIPRSPDTLEHPDIKGLYPCGEGAGYAGGIVSAAIDGQQVVEAIMQAKNQK